MAEKNTPSSQASGEGSIDPQLLDECATWLWVVSLQFNSRMESLLKPYGMTVAQFTIFHHIVRPVVGGNGMLISEIAAAVEVQQPMVTKTVTKLVAEGLVTTGPDPKDGRAKRVRPLPSAEARLKEIKKGMGADLTQLFNALAGSDLQSFAGDLKQLGLWLASNRLNDN